MGHPGRHGSPRRLHAAARRGSARRSRRGRRLRAGHRCGCCSGFASLTAAARRGCAMRAPTSSPSRAPTRSSCGQTSRSSDRARRHACRVLGGSRRTGVVRPHPPPVACRPARADRRRPCRRRDRVVLVGVGLADHLSGRVGRGGASRPGHSEGAHLCPDRRCRPPRSPPLSPPPRRGGDDHRTCRLRRRDSHSPCPGRHRVRP